MNATLTELTDYSTSARKVYEVTLQSVPDVAGTTPMTIKGWYAEPTKAGKYPTLVQFQGTDGGKSTVTCPLKGDDNPGWVQFVLSTRGQMQCRDDKYGYDFYSYCWGDTAKHYYRNAYLDCARAVDFVKSRDCVNQKQIFATGGSQGGCFTYIAEALTQAFRAIAPSITGHADFQHGMEIVNWPRAKFMIAQKNLGWTDAQRDAFNSYYDTKNFTDRVTCPVISCFSLQDTTDPTHTNIAPYNLLTTKDKEYIINPFLGHATPSEWPTRYFAFFQKYIDADNASKPVQTVWTGSQKIDWSDKTGNYWQKVDASAFSGIKEGMKVRFNYTNLIIGAQGHICKASDWSNFDGDAAKYLSLSSSYFEFPVTSSMVTELKNNGCIVTGIGYTLTSVDLINTANIPNIACSVDSATIKCWEKGETPHLDVVLENKTSEKQSTSVKLSLRTDKYVAMEGSSKEVTLSANEKKTVSFPLTLTAGFYHAIVEANYNALADFNIGYDPTEMTITPDAHVTCPVYTVMGLQDPVCPPRTNFAPYINFASTEKSYKVNPFCQHDPGTNWYSEYMAFFKNHLKPTSTGIHNAIVSARQDDKTYNLAGQRVGSQYKGLVIVNGKKRINK